ncbi:MAG: triose-phosphate isomerase [Bacilli bacterium]|nr:triose-phosphate isomerase [Bacilli bacterium]
MKYLICNLKANKTYYEMLIYKDNLRNLKYGNIEFILAPSNIYLPLFKREDVSLCCQDIALNADLNLTGDISLEQLESLDVKYTIIGHYERRKYYHESEHDIILKIKAALAHKIKVIYCIGEDLEDVERRVEYQVLERKLARVLNNIPNTELKNIIIAYEPNYMIGSNHPLDFSKIKDNINFIKNLINSYYNGTCSVVYGGNITPENIAEFPKIKNLDGIIIGASSLDITNIKTIIDTISHKN